MSGKLAGDLKYYLDENGQADINVEGRFADEDDGLETAIILSLFSDRRAAEDDEFPDDSGFKGGYWGDALKGNNLGSRAWLLRRSKATDETINKYQEYFAEALEWMIDEEVASNVEVIVNRFKTESIYIEINVKRSNLKDASFRYYYNWENELIKRG